MNHQYILLDILNNSTLPRLAQRLTIECRIGELTDGQYSDNVIRVNQAAGDRKLIKEISRNLAAGGNKLSR